VVNKKIAGGPGGARPEDSSDEEEIIRIITARETNKRERRIYLQQAGEVNRRNLSCRTTGAV
jgi:hypothetical protein